MTVEEAIEYFIKCNENLISVAKDENTYNFERQQIETICSRRAFEANKLAIKALELTQTGLLKDCESCKALEQEPCGDAISRQAVDDAIYEYSRSCDVNYAQIMEYIDKLPSVSTEKTGHWKAGAFADYYTYICSECNNSLFTEYAFCPYCGAKMEVEE